MGDRKPDLDIEGLHAIIDGFYAFQFLHAAVKFDLLSLLKKSLTREEVMTELGIAEQPARILLLGCVSLGLLRKQGNRYVCSDVAAWTLTGDAPYDARSLITFAHDTCYRAMWWLYDSLKQNTNVGLRELAGTSSTLYGRLANNPAAQRSFHKMMSGVSSNIARRFAQRADLSTGGRLVDVGGGAATNAIALASRWPALDITILDLPSAMEECTRAIELAGFHNRITTFAGDCFSIQFPACDHILFAHFLEIWSIDQIRGLLAKAHEAVAPGGGIYLINLIQQDDETGPPSAANVSAYFLTLASGVGMVYTWNEYEGWLRDAGFTPLQRIELSPAHGLIVGKKR
jgi:ubiquinone/menaquinone biosynthesis C-methylase UbiE